MPKHKSGKWDAKQNKYDSNDDPTRLKHDPFHTDPPQRDYVYTFGCVVCDSQVTVRGADKTQVDAAMVQLRRTTGGHELCDICISVGTRHFNLAERRKFWLKNKRRV